MLLNYLLVALRQLRRNKIFSLINVCGLVIGIAAALLIFSYCWKVLHYDGFHPEASSIYRLVQTASSQEEHVPFVSFGLAHQLKEGEELPWEVLRVADGTYWLGGEGGQVREKVFLADENFFEVLELPLEAGQRSHVLKLKNSAVISRELSMKLFGDENAVGKVLRINMEQEFVISGVMAPLPSNSVFQPQIVVPFSNIDELFYKGAEQGWHDTSCSLFLKAAAGEQASSIGPKAKDIFLAHAPADFREDERLFFGQPLTDVYVNKSGFNFNQNFLYPFGSTSYSRMVIFFGVGIFILVLAIVNYFNLSTSVFASRIEEIGIRKVTGASLGQLRIQFITEAVLTTFIALLLALAIFQLARASFAELIGEDLSGPLPGLGTTGIAAFLLVFGLLLGIINGIYPAFYLPSVAAGRAGAAFKTPPAKRSLFRNSLVTFQIFVSVCLVCCLVVMNAQLNFMQRADLGFDQKGVLTIPIDFGTTAQLSPRTPALAQELRQLGGIEQVSLHQASMGRHIKNFFSIHVGGEDSEREIHTTFIDDNYLKTFRLRLIAGTEFETINDSLKVQRALINETAARYLGWNAESAVGKKLRLHWKGGPELEVAGVVADFHLRSMHHAIDPALFLYATKPWEIEYISIRPRTSFSRQLLQSVEEKWSSYMGGVPFQYFFTADDYRRNFAADEGQLRGILLASCVAIVIACLGLFGLASYAAALKTKEIGVRKVLGASVGSIVVLLSKPFVRLSVLGFVLAVPTSIYFSDRWLANFAYRTELSGWMFLLPGALMCMVVLLSVSSQSIRASLTNPADSLKAE